MYRVRLVQQKDIDKIFKKKITEYGKKINIISNKLIQIITESLNGYKELDILNKKKLIWINNDKF